MSAVSQPLSFKVYLPWTFSSSENGADGDSQVSLDPTMLADDLEWSSLSSFFAQLSTLGTVDIRSQPHPALPSQARSSAPDKAPDSDFLDDTYIKISSDKKEGGKSKKKNKKKKKKGKCRKESHASQVQCEQPPDSFSPHNESTNGDHLALSSNHVATDAVLEYSSSSLSSLVEEPSVLGTSSGNEMEISSSVNDFRSLELSSGSNDFRSSDSTTGCRVVGSSQSSRNFGKAWNSICDNNTVRREWSSSASESRDFRGFGKWGGARNKPSHHQRFRLTISTITSVSGQEDSSYGDASRDDGFQQVISRKRAQRLKRMQLLDKSTEASISQRSKFVSRSPHKVTIGHYIKGTDLDCPSDKKEKHKMEKNQRGPNWSKGPTIVSTEDNVPGESVMLITTVQPGKSNSSKMVLSSASDQVANEAMEETSSSECLPRQEELKALPPKDADAKENESISSSSYETSSQHQFDNSSCVDGKEQKEEEDRPVLCTPASDLNKMIKAANHAYKTQAASDVYLVSGHPLADFETFIHSTTPVIGQILQGQPVCESPCQDQMSGITLRSVWQWYEEPGCFGLEVEIHRSLSSGSSGTYSGSELCAYFVPSLSAVQLFGQSKKLGNKFNEQDETSLVNERLIFEYTELEIPYDRPPLFSKIKQLVSGVNSSAYQMFGDPQKLESVQLSEVHPASWFCVAWYPIYRIPSGSCHAAFLTYHSLGKLVPQTCSSDITHGPTNVVCPIVGLLSYNNKGEQWFELRGPRFKLTSEGSSETDCAEVLKERLKALRHGASVISKAVVPRATGEAMNYHPDYEFFRSRSG
ncbi:hypothetical protein ACP70R_047048 [Stipagrostis hirtigluma subsp. patula]